jgi:cephalosporin-C deacetylase-like acetyl esterase
MSSRFPARSSLAGLVILLTSSAAIAQQPIFTPFHESGIYALGEPVGWTVTLPPGAAAPPGGCRYTVRKNNSTVIKTGTLDLSQGRGTIETALDEPAMVYVEVETSGAGRPTTLGAAVAPAHLRPSAPRPGDFDAFWDAKLRVLNDVPMDPALIPVETGQPGVELYTVKVGSLGSHVQGYLARPKKEGRFPALVIFQYAGVYALRPRTATDRAAEGWLAFNVDSHDLPPDQSTGVSVEYRTIGNTSRETSYFLNMYLRDSRAIDYIATRPDWDGRTIVVMGTSMGGQQSLVVAGLNPKVTAVIVNEPAGADSNGDLHGRKAGYPNWPSNDPKVMETALYFDTVNFAPRIKAPTLAAMGFIDTIAPPVGIWIALGQIPGPKEAIPMVESHHNNITPEKQGAYKARSEEVLGILLRGGQFKPDEMWTRR